MTRQKDLKRVVRTRMQKTGESYTAARRHVLAKPTPRTKHAAPTPEVTAPAAPPVPSAAVAPRTTSHASPSPADYAALAGMSDATVAAKTGCTWERWVNHLDRWGAAQKPHREIAEHVATKFKLPGWWAQSVTVGYERIRGLRDMHQRRGGGYETNKSKTVAVPVERLFAAAADDAERARWLPGLELEVRRATPSKSLRMTWGDGTSVEMLFTAKGETKSSVAVAHTKLPDAARAAELRAWWGERLEALAAMLAAAKD